MTNRDGILEADMLACDGGFYILQINSASGQSYYFKVVVF